MFIEIITEENTCDMGLDLEYDLEHWPYINFTNKLLILFIPNIGFGCAMVVLSYGQYYQNNNSASNKYAFLLLLQNYMLLFLSIHHEKSL